MLVLRDDAQARHLMRFFKTGKGEYGEGDRFLGLRVPATRAIVKEYKDMVSLADVVVLLNSQWHEVRLAAFLFMIEIYKREKKRSPEKAASVVDCYLNSIHKANNWDLVDLSAPYILGDWLVANPDQRGILHRLSDMADSLWHQRVAIVANWMLIRAGEFADTFQIAEKFLTHPHDLIHKATGWMLREVGKRGGMKPLCDFLDRFAPAMPRTMLRYAIEKFPEEKRLHYLRIPRITPGMTKTNHLSIRHSRPEDLPLIMDVYEKARMFMRSQGNHSQWIDGYPSEEVIIKDIDNRNHYTGVTEDGRIAMVFTFIIGDDPTYKLIEKGDWLNDRPYGTIHRIASNGICSNVLKVALDFCYLLIDNIRVDTHADNRPMLTALQRHGFERCGIIYTGDGSPRIAFQKSTPTPNDY